MSSQGTVAASGLYATLQSAMMGGYGVAVVGPAVAAIDAAATAASWFGLSRLTRKEKVDDSDGDGAQARDDLEKPS